MSRSDARARNSMSKCFREASGSATYVLARPSDRIARNFVPELAGLATPIISKIKRFQRTSKLSADPG